MIDSNQTEHFAKSFEVPGGTLYDGDIEILTYDGETELMTQCDKKILKENLLKAMATLSDREQRVLHLRFGIFDNRPRTLEEIGREFGLSRERIRQIEVKALRRLRHPARKKIYDTDGEMSYLVRKEMKERDEKYRRYLATLAPEIRDEIKPTSIKSSAPKYNRKAIDEYKEGDIVEVLTDDYRKYDKKWHGWHLMPGCRGVVLIATRQYLTIKMNDIYGTVLPKDNIIDIEDNDVERVLQFIGKSSSLSPSKLAETLKRNWDLRWGY